MYPKFPRRILFVQPTNPAAYPPLINASMLLAEQGWQVDFLTLPKRQDVLTLPAHPLIEETRTPERIDFTVSTQRYFDYCRRALALALSRRPTVVYASDPIGALPGLLAAKVIGAKLVYHEHDSPLHERLNPLVAFFRKAAVKNAYRVVFPNAHRADKSLGQMHLASVDPHIVWNLPRIAEIPHLTSHPGSPMIVHYHGTIVPDRLPLTVAEAIARMRGGAMLRVAGYETASGRGYTGLLLSRYGRVEDGGIVEEVGTVARQGLLDLAAKAHVGLALMPTESDDLNMKHMTGASNKAFDYMAAGLPIVVTDNAQWKEMFVRPGYGLAVNPNDSDSIETALRWFLEHPEQRAEMGRRARRKIEREWNYDRAFAPLLAELDAI